VYNNCIMNITKRLQEIDPTLILHNEGNWSEPLDPTKPGYTSFNDAGVETETGEFLYSMVRILKPEFVLETGTHIGVGAAYMGQALKDNRNGILETVEFIPELRDRAKIRIQQLQLELFVFCHLGDVAKFEPSHTYKMILLDTEPQTRFAELIKFEPFLEPGGFVFIHDLHRHMAQVTPLHPDHPGQPYWPWGPLPEAVKELVQNDELRPFHFGTPRGLTGFYKPDMGDYKAWDA